MKGSLKPISEYLFFHPGNGRFLLRSMFKRLLIFCFTLFILGSCIKKGIELDERSLPMGKIECEVIGDKKDVIRFLALDQDSLLPSTVELNFSALHRFVSVQTELSSTFYILTPNTKSGVDTLTTLKTTYPSWRSMRPPPVQNYLVTKSPDGLKLCDEWPNQQIISNQIEIKYIRQIEESEN